VLSRAAKLSEGGSRSQGHRRKREKRYNSKWGLLSKGSRKAGGGRGAKAQPEWAGKLRAQTRPAP